LNDSRALSYPTYLELDQLLSLQRPQSTPEHPDELLFIVVHQASELWFKVLLHEFDQLIAHLETGEVQASLTTMQRINTLVELVSHELSALDTLPPQRFMQFRGYLGSSSGSQSAQFRAIEATSGLRDPHFMSALKEHGELPPRVARALEKPTLQALFLSLIERQGVSRPTVCY
jgi:tryptophan 2,3-dioxygenase